VFVVGNTDCNKHRVVEETDVHVSVNLESQITNPHLSSFIIKQKSQTLTDRQVNEHIPTHRQTSRTKKAPAAHRHPISQPYELKRQHGQSDSIADVSHIT
jgi:hypothetical protein